VLCVAILANLGGGVKPSGVDEGEFLGGGTSVAVVALMGVPCLAQCLPSGVWDPWCGDRSGVGGSDPGEGVAVVALVLACHWALFLFFCLVGATGVVGLEANERVDCPFRCFFFEEDVSVMMLLTMGVGSRSCGSWFRGRKVVRQCCASVGRLALKNSDVGVEIDTWRYRLL
jgi:hypothetical protein